MKLNLTFTSLFMIVFVALSLTQPSIYSGDAIHQPIVSEQGMVATQHAVATAVGVEILKSGGNAVDAAVGVGFALAVVLPRAGNLGGGGFMLVYDAAGDTTIAINYREMAPLAAHRDLYLDNHQQVDKEKYMFSYQSAGVPGSVAGLCMALDHYGTMSLAAVLAPAIRLAEKGFVVTYHLSQILKRYEDRLKKWPETAKIFYKDGGYYEAGDTLIQKDLAWSLKQIARYGPSAFYGGEVGKRLVKDMKDHNGLITIKDLDQYHADIVTPIYGTYRGYRIATMPPPSSGGIHLVQMLNILEGFPLSYFGHNSAQSIHVMAESMKYAYADRSEYLGDPAFVDVPWEVLTSKDYAADIRSRISPLITRPSADIKPGVLTPYESNETTHFSVVDRYGNAVSNTYTINFSFGSGIVAKGTGILLNNEMGDFSAKPGEPDAYGLVGGIANSIRAKKRPLSSMTPSMVFNDKGLYLVTGSPGGSRIITTVLQIILNVIDHKMNIADASHAPRIHHQWYPDILFMEKGISMDTQEKLLSKRYHLQYRYAMGSTQSILKQGLYLFGASDPRRPDASTLGY